VRDRPSRYGVNAMVLSLPQPIATQRHSLKAYRQLEETAEGRREFRDGEIIEMTGGSLEHSQIIGNLYYLLGTALKGTPFRLFPSELRLWIPSQQRGTYPDAMVFEGRPQLNAPRRDEVLNPRLIAEVLSPSTEAYDSRSETLRERGDKFLCYRTIPELREYLLISSTQMLIDHYVKTDAQQWLLQSYQSPTQSVTLPTLDVQLAIADLYKNVTFETAVPQPE
jgi:Uma2 family endonuclease